MFSFPFMLMMLLPSHGEDQQTPRQTISSQTVMMTMTDMMITIETGSRPKGIVFKAFPGDLRVRVECSASPWLRLCYGLRERERRDQTFQVPAIQHLSLSVCSSESICLREEFLDSAVCVKRSLLSPQTD